MDAQNTMGLKYHFNEMYCLTDGCKGCYAVELAASELHSHVCRISAKGVQRAHFHCVPEMKQRSDSPSRVSYRPRATKERATGDRLVH